MHQHIGVMEADTNDNEGLRKAAHAKRSPSFHNNRERRWQPDDGNTMAPPCALFGGGAGLPPEEYIPQGGNMEDNRVKVDLQFGFNPDQAEEALAILISGRFMFEAFQEQRARFRSNYPEVFSKSEELMIADGATPDQATKNTLDALEQYFDLLGKMLYMLGYELAEEMAVPYPTNDELDKHREVSDTPMNEEEVMNELARIMNINN
jgi:hypothetical protein